jgi:hypothetical protein
MCHHSDNKQLEGGEQQLLKGEDKTDNNKPDPILILIHQSRVNTPDILQPSSLFRKLITLIRPIFQGTTLSPKKCLPISNMSMTIEVTTSTETTQ